MGGPRGAADGTLLVTGTPRAGTTLADKLLAAHPRLSILSQPFPLLLVELKRVFLRGLAAAEERYPLGPLLGERRYRPADLELFLAEWRCDVDWLREVLELERGYSGRYSPRDTGRLEAAVEAARGQSLGGTLASLWRHLAHRAEVAIVGAKETLVEEFLPRLLAEGGAGLVILRDPRDVLASVNHGAGRWRAGRPKPTLFNVAHWRKSVAYALHLERRGRCRWVRYEDLTRSPEGALEGVAEILAVPGLGRVDGELRDQEGRPWAGNSSFGALRGVSEASVGRWRELLPERVRRFVEATCLPEMRVLGYEATLRPDAAADAILSFVDPYPLERPELAAWTASSALAREVRRLELLTARSDEPAEDPLFLLPGVQALLAAELGR